jgi:large subunit ribosomal protein L21
VPSRRSYIYAVIRSGGKQYKVEPNQLLDVELLPADVGAVVELSDVLLVADGDDVTVGQPLVDGARVVAEVVEHGRGPKIIVFKYKNKTRYRRRTGHRQSYTRLAIRQILVGAEPAAVAAPAKARRPRAPAKPAAKPEAAPPEVEEAAVMEEQPEAAAPVSEAPVAEEAPAADEPVSMEAAPPAEAPKTRRRRPAAPKATEEAPPKPARPRPTGRAKRGE